jgi:hypothetical protein
MWDKFRKKKMAKRIWKCLFVYSNMRVYFHFCWPWRVSDTCRLIVQSVQFWNLAARGHYNFVQVGDTMWQLQHETIFKHDNPFWLWFAKEEKRSSQKYQYVMWWKSTRGRLNPLKLTTKWCKIQNSGHFLALLTTSWITLFYN